MLIHSLSKGSAHMQPVPRPHTHAPSIPGIVIPGYRAVSPDGDLGTHVVIFSTELLSLRDMVS